MLNSALFSLLPSRRTPLCVRALLAGLVGFTLSLQAAGPIEVGGEGRRAPPVSEIEAAVRRAVSPEGLATALGTRPAEAIELIQARLEGERLTLDFNRGLLALLPGSAGFEQVSRRIHHAVGAVLDPVFTQYEVHTVIDGVPLHRIFEALEGEPVSTVQSNRPSPPSPPATAGLSARSVALSPGHGYYFNGTAWVLQRSPFFGIVEDFINHDLITLVDEEMRAAGAQVFPTRELNRLAGTGESGFARWQEAARYHIKALGADASIWNESGFTHLEQDIRCRPRYANAIQADVLISLHNNGGGGTGTETLYDTHNTAAAGSKRLADALHGAIITAIRRDFNAAWPDRRVKGFNGSYGENRLATRPSVIIELAFMDRQSPDNEALQIESFRRLVARAIREGLAAFYAPPETPDGLRAVPDASGIDLSWNDTADNEEGFRIERRGEDSDAWSALVSTGPGVRTHRDATAVAGVSYVYRVFAFNSNGSSARASNEASASRPPASTTLSLVADGGTDPAVRDWSQSASFSFRVVDGTGTPVPGATVEVSDGLQNRTTSVAVSPADALARAVFETSVPDGQANGSYTLTFRATRPGYTASAAVTRTIQVQHSGGAGGAPRVGLQPASLAVTAGNEARLEVRIEGTGSWTYQWQRDGVSVPGATGASLVFPAVAPADAGRYRLLVTHAQGSVTSLEAILTVTPRTWLSNVSIRTPLAVSQTVIVGFVVAGGSKDLLVRAAGPSLAAFGLPSAMTDPQLVLYRDATRVAANNDWAARLASTMASVGAFPFPAASRDAALLQSVNGAHTVHATGTGAGVVLIEGYDTGTDRTARVVNLSARNRVGTGADILITGFFVSGTGTQRLLIRAAGPALTALGVPGALANPRLEILQDSTRLQENDDWSPGLASTFAQVGAFPFPAGSRDAAVIVTLDAGRSYTAQVSGVGDTTGEALIEVYELPQP